MLKEESKSNASFSTCAQQFEGIVLRLTLYSNLINDALEQDAIDWDHVASFGLENIKISFRKRNSIKTRVRGKNKDILVAGYVIWQQQKGGKAFAKESGFDMDNHQVSLSCFFKRNSKRKRILVEFLDYADLEWENTVRYLKTRWLSLK